MEKHAAANRIEFTPLRNGVIAGAETGCARFTM